MTQTLSMNLTDTNPSTDSYIMRPTVDYCFKELMNNPKVRQGLAGCDFSVERSRRTFRLWLIKMSIWKKHITRSWS